MKNGLPCGAENEADEVVELLGMSNKAGDE